MVRDQLLMVEDYAYAGGDFRVTTIYRFHLVHGGVTLVRNKTLKWQLCFYVLMFYIFYV